MYTRGPFFRSVLCRICLHIRHNTGQFGVWRGTVNSSALFAKRSQKTASIFSKWTGIPPKECKRDSNHVLSNIERIKVAFFSTRFIGGPHINPCLFFSIFFLSRYSVTKKRLKKKGRDWYMCIGQFFITLGLAKRDKKSRRINGLHF